MGLDHKEVFIEKLDALRAEYAEKHGLELSTIPSYVDDALADRAMVAADEYFRQWADREKDRFKEAGQWPPR